MNSAAPIYTNRSVYNKDFVSPGMARRTRHMDASAIREILKATAAPGIISLAGGLPAAEALPVDLLGRLVETALSRFGPNACQYSPSEGFPPLRHALSGYLATEGISAPAETIAITSGAQGALDALGKILITPGCPVAVEAPTYLGALQAFAPYGPAYIRLDTDDDGVLPESLDHAIRTHGARLIYLVPTFQNPTGRTLSEPRRHAIASILNATGAWLIEDDPYRALRFNAQPLAPIKTLAPDRVVYVGSFSKMLSPGLRLGYMVAPEPIHRWSIIARQGTDLHAGTLGQAIAALFLDGGHAPTHLDRVAAIYRRRHRAMADALGASFPSDFAWTTPEGGMFKWVTGPPDFSSQSVYEAALARGTAIVPGQYFYAWPAEGCNTFRLNFTGATSDQIHMGIRTLASTIRSQQISSTKG